MPANAPIHEQPEPGEGSSFSDCSLVSWELRSNFSSGTPTIGGGSVRAELLGEELAFQTRTPQTEPSRSAVAISRPSSAHLLREPAFEYAFSMIHEDDGAPGLFDIVRVSEDPVDAPNAGPGAEWIPRSVWSPSEESWRLISVCSSDLEFDRENADMGSIANAFRACARVSFHAGRVALADTAREAAIAAYESYTRLRDRAVEADLEARRAYDVLLTPHAQGAAAVAPEQLGAAHAMARAAAHAHTAAEAAARSLRAAYVTYAVHAFAVADGATNAGDDFMRRGWAALQVVEDALLMEASHFLLRAVFEAVAKGNDPCQPLQPVHGFPFGDREALEEAVRFSARAFPQPGEEGEIAETGSIGYQEVHAAAGEAAHAWWQHRVQLDTAWRFDGAFLTTQNEESDWLRALLRPLWNASLEGDESLRAVQAEIITVLQAALAADVTPALRAAQSVFLLVASSTQAYAARAYVSSIAHLIHIALAAPHGVLPLVPSRFPPSEVMHHFTNGNDQVSNAFDAQSYAVRAVKDLFDLLGRLVSVLLVIQSVPAFRFAGPPDAP